MFCYAKDSDNARCFRPDLHGLLLTWIACVPAEAWQYFVAFRVGTRGTLIMKFLKAAATGGPLRLIEVEVSSTGTVIRSPTHYWHEERPVILSMTALNLAADTI